MYVMLQMSAGESTDYLKHAVFSSHHYPFRIGIALLVDYATWYSYSVPQMSSTKCVAEALSPPPPAFFSPRPRIWLRAIGRFPYHQNHKKNNTVLSPPCSFYSNSSHFHSGFWSANYISTANATGDIVQQFIHGCLIFSNDWHMQQMRAVLSASWRTRRRVWLYWWRYNI